MIGHPDLDAWAAPAPAWSPLAIDRLHQIVRAQSLVGCNDDVMSGLVNACLWGAV